MSDVYGDRVRETTNTTGTGHLTLRGPVAGYRRFHELSDWPFTCRYCIVDANGTAWETGQGTITDETTLQRTTVVYSSSGGTKISLSAGTHQVFCTLSAETLGFHDAANVWTQIQEFSELLRCQSNISITKATNYGIQLGSPGGGDDTFGWRDILGDISIRAVGANDPTFAAYRNGLYAFQFSATVMKEVFINFHIPHDYVPGTDVYFHVHWSNAAAAPNTGNVRWGFEYSYAKGYNQAAFPASSTVYVAQASPATQYQHNIAETAAVTISGLEVDGIILVRVFRDAADGADTCTDAVFLHMSDLHYQSTNIATKARNGPAFYT